MAFNLSQKRRAHGTVCVSEKNVAYSKNLYFEPRMLPCEAVYFAHARRFVCARVLRLIKRHSYFTVNLSTICSSLNSPLQATPQGYEERDSRVLH